MPPRSVSRRRSSASATRRCGRRRREWGTPAATAAAISPWEWPTTAAGSTPATATAGQRDHDREQRGLHYVHAVDSSAGPGCPRTSDRATFQSTCGARAASHAVMCAREQGLGLPVVAPSQATGRTLTGERRRRPFPAPGRSLARRRRRARRPAAMAVSPAANSVVLGDHDGPVLEFGPAAETRDRRDLVRVRPRVSVRVSGQSAGARPRSAAPRFA